MVKDNSSNFCFWGCLAIAGIVSIITGISIHSSYLSYEGYDTKQCLVTQVNYPKNYSSKYLWGQCRCGKRCYAYNPIIQIFVNITHNNFTDNYLLYYNLDNKGFTFFNTSCRDGKHPNYIDVALTNAQYYNHFFLNRTLICYFNDESDNPILYKIDYLHNTLNYICFVVIGCSSLCCLCQGCCNFKSIFCCK